MLIGKAIPATTSISTADATCVEFPAAMIKAIPPLARTAGLLSHLAEEQERPIGFLMASHGEAAISYASEDGKPPE